MANKYLLTYLDPPEIPSRPIIAGPSSPTHRLSKFLDIILRPLTEKVKSYVRDDIEFLSHLPKQIDFESTFVALDVTSLYTNISHERVLKLYRTRLKHTKTTLQMTGLQRTL